MHISKVTLCPFLDLGASRRGSVLQPQKPANVFHGEPEFPGTQDKTQACGVCGGIDAVAGVRAGWVGQKADFLVIADRLDVAASRPGQISAC